MKYLPLTTIPLAALAMTASLGLAGCDDQGPAETAGEKIDEAVESAGEMAEDAGDKVEEATDKLK